MKRTLPSLALTVVVLTHFAACDSKETRNAPVTTTVERETHEKYDIYNDCPKEGNAVNTNVKSLNLLKNRTDVPIPYDMDSSVTLAAMSAPGDDTQRWSVAKAATVEGYVYDVKIGGVETCNCKAKDAAFRDTHVELVVDPMNADGGHRVIAEVTPRWRAIMREKGIDWSTRGLRDQFKGRWVRVTGWLLFDIEHDDESENTAPGRERNWRGTAWEIHPITSIEVIGRPR